MSKNQKKVQSDPKMCDGIDSKCLLDEGVGTLQKLFSGHNTRIVDEYVHITDVRFNLNDRKKKIQQILR